MNKDCKTCKWLVRYESNDHASYMDVCTSENPEEVNDGMYHVVVIDITEFDASYCLNYKSK